VSTSERRPKPPEAHEVERVFRPGGWLLEAETALGHAIEVFAVQRTPYKLTILDLLVRLSLAPEKQLRGVDLCRQLLKSPGYVSRVIDEAENEGLVLRSTDSKDRRAQQITLTGAGEDVLEIFVPHAVTVLKETVYSVLNDDEVETLIDLLTRVAASAHLLLETEGTLST